MATNSMILSDVFMCKLATTLVLHPDDEQCALVNRLQPARQQFLVFKERLSCMNVFRLFPPFPGNDAQ
jgi:hypothetical protein